MNIDRVRQLAGLPLTESKVLKENSYDSSIDFEDDVEKVSKAIDQLKTILGSAEWQEWMEASDSNFGKANKFASRSSQLLWDVVVKLDKDFDAIYGDLVRVSEE